MKRLLKLLVDEESGQGMVEYGLLIMLIAIVVGVIEILGLTVSNMYVEAESKLPWH